jgi:enterochelin esterase-like enzyme
MNSAPKPEVNVMKSHATALILVGAVFLSAAAAVAQTPRTMNGTLVDATVSSANVPGPVPITYYLPKNYDAKRAEPYPLLLQLHGGGGSNKAMENGMGRLLDQAIERGLVPPMVSVMPSAGRSFYMNFRDGSEKWEDLVMKDLLPYMRKNFNIVAVIDLAEIQHLPLDHLATGAALVLDDIPIAMLFAVFEASVVSQEHDADDVG